MVVVVVVFVVVFFSSVLKICAIKQCKNDLLIPFHRPVEANITGIIRRRGWSGLFLHIEPIVDGCDLIAKK